LKATVPLLTQRFSFFAVRWQYIYRKFRRGGRSDQKLGKGDE
jgi:hypothetical protein